mgnify:CR=1 FL=1
MIVWGCDPGLSGAIALFNAGDGVVETWDMPIVEVRGKKAVSPQLIKNILELHDAPIWVEQVSARPGQGVTSMFNFGKSYGMVLGVAAGLGYPINYVTPQTWKKAVRCPEERTAAEPERWNCCQRIASCSLERKTMAVQRLL